MSTFEGKRGKAVESEEAISSWYDNDENMAKYDDDPSYRVEVGPHIKLYGDCEYDESLFGLQLDLDLGTFGTLRGIVRGKKEVTVDGARPVTIEQFEIEWRCGPDFDEGGAFVLPCSWEGYDILAWYYLGREDRPSWLDDHKVDEKVLQFLGALKSAPKGTTLVNWQQPYSIHDVFGGLNDNDEMWEITLNRLNDPEAAECYGSPSDRLYPVPFLLACYAFAMQIDESTDPPTIVTKDKEELYEMVDEFARVLATRHHHRAGYGELMGLEHIVGQYNKDWARNEEYWPNAYRFAQALVLLLSDSYENNMRDHHMVDDPERLHKLCADILGVFNSTMSPEGAPSDAAREQLKKDLEFNNHHLREGSFMGIVQDDYFLETGDNMDAYVKFKGCLGKKRDWESSSEEEEEEAEKAP